MRSRPVRVRRAACKPAKVPKAARSLFKVLEQSIFSLHNLPSFYDQDIDKDDAPAALAVVCTLLQGIPRHGLGKCVGRGLAG
jgi:hypothetical protein